MYKKLERTTLAAVLLSLSFASVYAVSAPLSLPQAVALATEQDNWLVRSNLQQQGLKARAISAAQLPDPTFRLGLANLPTDSFNLRQENMTQLQVGIKQQFPRGDTLALKRRQLEQRAQLEPLSRQLRQAELMMQVGSLWLNSWRARAKIQVIERQRQLFKQLSQVSEVRYRSGRSERHEVLQAEIALERLQERVVQLAQLRDQHRGMLYRWLPVDAAKAPLTPELTTLSSFDLDEVGAQTQLMQHPSALLSEQRIGLAKTAKQLTAQQYKPRWGLSGQYAYRANGSQARADLASIAVTFSVPILPRLRQDPLQRAAAFDVQAQREEKLLTLRELSGRWRSGEASKLQLQKRLSRYRNRLIPKASERRRAAMQAYASDTADITQVIEAANDELALQLSRLDLKVDYQQQLLLLNYLLSPDNLQLQGNPTKDLKESDNG